MEPTDVKQLNVINRIRMIGRTFNDLSFEELLDYVGISQQKYLEFGQIWRDLGKNDHSASFRQTDQFILISDIMKLIERTSYIFNISKFDLDKLRTMDLTIMGKGL
jgi:hypothetical protein